MHDSDFRRQPGRWGADMEIKQICPSHEDSYEAWLHASGKARFLLDLRAAQRALLHQQLLMRRLQRYIGVIYRPESELHSHYLEASLPQCLSRQQWAFGGMTG